MTTSRKETILDWAANFIGLAGGIPAIAEKIGKVWGVLPPNVQEKISQKMPGIMGLSKADEQIFNSLLAKLSIADQKELTNFLFTKCQVFQRDSFRVIVAGMELIKGTPEVVEKKWNKSANKFEEKITSKRNDEDLRLIFLKRFAKYVKTYGLDEAYNACIATNMFADYSTLQNIQRSAQSVSNPTKGLFVKTFGATAQNAANQKIQDAFDRRRRR
jgi:hypothetical protein